MKKLKNVGTLREKERKLYFNKIKSFGGDLNE